MNHQNYKLRLKDWGSTLLIYTLMISSALMIYGFVFPSANNIIEIPPVMALLNPEIFKHDYYVQDSLKVTPRYYYQYLIFWVTRLGLSIPQTYFFIYLLAFSSFIIGLYFLGNRFGRSKLSSACLIFLGLFAVSGNVGYVSIFRPEPIPAVLAMGLSIWGIYFSFCRRWNLGYLFFGLACIIQFLIGLLPGILFCPILLLDYFKQNKLTKSILPLLILMAFAALIYLPMVINGSTSSGEISNEEFVFLYGYIRQPHHIIPSSFPIQNWRSFLSLMISGFLFISASQKLSKNDKNNFFIIICMSLILLLLGYVFVEIYPTALIAKLQFARTTPFAQLIVLISLSVLITEHYDKKNFSLCFLLLLLPINKNGNLLLLLVAIGFTILRGTNNLQILRSRWTTWMTGLGVLLFILLYPPSASISATVISKRIIGKFLLFFVLSFPFWKEKILSLNYRVKVMAYGLLFASYSLFLLGLLNVLPKQISRILPKSIRIAQVNNDELNQLALRIKNSITPDALVLTPPSMTRFRFYSQRSVVYNFYCSPYTDEGIIEWKERLTEIVGTIRPPLSLRNIDYFYRKRTESELIDIAKKHQADYILTRNSWHSNFQDRILDRQGDLIIYKVDNLTMK